jgi:catechol 2,3-dioxygenase-like lactoylglutathione lyase family enzyme
MLSHLSLGVRDLDRAQTFYDAALKPLGVVKLFRTERCLGYGPPGQEDGLALFRQDDANGSLAAGPGFHLAFEAPSRDAVDAFHAAALSTGGRDDGPPGLRPHYGDTYYAAFVIDPDGHKLEAVHQ